jgi:hypothetical protein
MADSYEDGHAAPSAPEASANSAQHAVDVTKRAAKGLVKDVKGDLKELSSELKQEFQSKATSQMGGIADSIEGLSAGLTDTSASLDEAWAKPLLGHAATALQSLAVYMRDADPQSLMQDAQRLAKERPATTMLGSVAVGFALARAGKVLMAQLPETSPSAEDVRNA